MTVSGAGSSTSQTQIAGGADGSSWVVWKRAVAGFDVIQGTRVQADGSQGAIVTLSSPAMDATDPVIEARSDGSAIVAWLNLSALDDTVHSRSIAADGTLGPIETRSTVGPLGQPAKDIAVAVGEDGSAAVTWTKYDGSEWVVQAVRVAANGTGGTIHDVSDPASSAGQPAIAEVGSIVEGAPASYRLAWPQGSGGDANVYSRQVSSDDVLETEIYKALWPRIPAAQGDPVGPGTGGDPQDVHIAYGTDGGLHIAWIRHRADYIINGANDTVSQDPNNPGFNPADPADTPFQNWAVEAVRGLAGQTLSNAFPLQVAPLTPVVEGTPYNVSDFDMSGTRGGFPVMTWVHNLNGGDDQVETGRIRKNGIFIDFVFWANPSAVLPAVENPVIAANASMMGVTGWTEPGLAPGQDEVSWTRFSNNAFDPFTPTGSFVYSVDPGFVVADNGNSLAAFTAIDGVSVGTSRISVYTDPGIRVDPSQHNFGRTDIGRTSTRFITVRSSGETPVEVSGISLSGANAGRYQLTGENACVGVLPSGASCRFEVAFTPGSTAVQTAKVTVSSELGNDETNLTGSGLNRTRNRITANPRSSAVRRGRVVRVRVTAANLGGVASSNTRVCVNLNKRALRLAGNRCRSLGSLPAGANRKLNFRIRVTGRARSGARQPVTFRMSSGNAILRQVVVNVRRKGS